MKYNQLGRTGIEVSDICLGTMTWGSQNSEAEAHEQLDYAVSEGVNFFDTAEMYPTTPRKAETTGLTEELCGTWLKGRADRDKIVVATKATGEGNADIRNGARLTGKVLREALEGSLKRLQTDVIDLYQMHWPNRGSYHFRQYWTFDPNNIAPGNMEDEVIDILREVEKLQAEGKLRAFGMSNETAWGTMKWLEISEKHRLPRIAAMQNEYSLACRIYDLDMAEISVNEDVGLLSYSPLAAGSLSGKYRDGTIPSGSRRELSDNLNGRYVAQTERVIDQYAMIAERHGLNLAQMSLAFCRQRPFMMSTIIGATSMEQLKTNIDSKDVQLSAEVLEEIQMVYRETPQPM